MATPSAVSIDRLSTTSRRVRHFLKRTLVILAVALLAVPIRFSVVVECVGCSGAIEAAIATGREQPENQV
jgi:hypothetical protein